MNPKNFSVEFKSKEEFKKIAQKVRKKSGYTKIPIKVLKIAEIHFKLQSVLIPRLYKDCNMDALLTSNFEQIYVDDKAYLEDRFQKRFRFSVAHEIGHLVMHKKIWENLEIKNKESYKSAVKKLNEDTYNNIETQADMFANNLLIPRHQLISKREEIIESQISPKKNPEEFNEKTLNKYISKPISKIFKVSEDAAKIALDSLENK